MLEADSPEVLQTVEEGVTTLELPQVLPANAGEYKCLIFNEAGEDSVTVEVNVTGVLYSSCFATLFPAWLVCNIICWHIVF